MGHAKQLRLVAPIALVAIALAGIAPAAASGASYTGSFPNGGTMSFNAVTKHGKIVRVKRFSWSGVPVSCLQGDSSYTAQLPVSMSVLSRAFSAQALGTDLTQSVTGHFRDRGRKASGTLNVFGVLGLSRTGCSTGKLAWSAARG